MLVPLLAATTVLNVRVDTAPAHVLNTIRPLHAIGTGIDSDPDGKIPFLYAPAQVRPALEAGLGFVSYRLYTELSIQDWHWNPAGSFTQGDRGYWTSAPRPSSAAIVNSYGYILAHRGDTRDQGDDNGYSRIDDGDSSTYWKSNPYLTSRYTGDPDSQHPQWVVIDLDAMRAVDGIRIAWVNPYATHFLVQYWVGNGSKPMPYGAWHQPPGTDSGQDLFNAITDQARGTWRTFPNGDIRDGHGGNALIRLSESPLQAHWIRVLMDASSNTCDSHGGGDPRNCVGYAIQDVSVGLIDAAGRLHDDVRHTSCGGDPSGLGCAPHQSTIYVSSEDPWHRAADRIRSGQDQPGLDIVSRSLITRGIAMMYPVPLFYSTPENAANEIRYLRARHYPLEYIEMGEEVDGQYAMPEDYAALYVQFARAIHRADPHVQLGGPVFEGVNVDVPIWPDGAGDTSWFHRFVRYLESHGAMGQLQFMSFEHYPFAGCDQDGALFEDLVLERSLVKGIIDTWHADGLPKTVPFFMTEVNFANDGGPVPKQLSGALWMADWVGTSLSSGAAGLNYYKMELDPLGRKRECNRWGGYGMFVVDDKYRIVARAAQFYAARMLTHEWLVAGDAPHGIYPALNDFGSDEVTSYAAKRPDGTWSVMLVNKDPIAYQVRPAFADGARVLHFGGMVRQSTFGSAQYGWRGLSQTEMPSPNRGIESTAIAANASTIFSLPAESITVLSGTIR